MGTEHLREIRLLDPRRQRLEQRIQKHEVPKSMTIVSPLLLAVELRFQLALADVMQTDDVGVRQEGEESGFDGEVGDAPFELLVARLNSVLGSELSEWYSGGHFGGREVFHRVSMPMVIPAKHTYQCGGLDFRRASLQCVKKQRLVHEGRARRNSNVRANGPRAALEPGRRSRAPKLPVSRSFRSAPCEFSK
mmetsp:Transcript_39873/g.83370  ORF Transcript_39873/g.83370 Transcript_39873/m.83370 type:complete len:192 (-) Transcript_39873:1716-2291(-)